MKKSAFIFIISLFILSCDSDEVPVFTNDLNKRIVMLEGYDSFNSNSFVSDSVIEYYENKKIIRKDSYLKLSYNTPYIKIYSIYEYNNDHLLSTIKSYTDINLTNHYRTLNYNYSADLDILNVVSNKFSPSNFSSTLSNKTIHYEYVLDTIKKYSIDHLNNNFREDLKTYITYGNLDSINSNDDWMYKFDNQNDITAINCLGNNNNCIETYNTSNEYGNSREPLIENTYGNILNSFLLGSSIIYNRLETSNKYLNKTLSLYPTPERNDNARIFNYTFDQDDRLIEVYTTGTYLTVNRIQYLYE